jgi:hypothetical protein
MPVARHIFESISGQPPRRPPPGSRRGASRAPRAVPGRGLSRARAHARVRAIGGWSGIGTTTTGGDGVAWHCWRRATAASNGGWSCGNSKRPSCIPCPGQVDHVGDATIRHMHAVHGRPGLIWHDSETAELHPQGHFGDARSRFCHLQPIEHARLFWGVSVPTATQWSSGRIQRACGRLFGNGPNSRAGAAICASSGDRMPGCRRPRARHVLPGRD